MLANLGEWALKLLAKQNLHGTTCFSEYLKKSRKSDSSHLSGSLCFVSFEIDLKENVFLIFLIAHNKPNKIMSLNSINARQLV